MLIFVSTNKVWGIYLVDPTWLVFELSFFVYFGFSSRECRWLECLVTTLRGGASEPGVMAQISISCASYLATLTPSRNVNILFRPTKYEACYLVDPTWLLFELAFFVYFDLSSRECRWLECLVTRTLGGGASEPGVVAQISISCASYLASLTQSLNVNICSNQQCMRHAI